MVTVLSFLAASEQLLNAWASSCCCKATSALSLLAISVKLFAGNITSLVPAYGSVKITVYTDGAASGNPGPGGYGAVLIAGEREMAVRALGRLPAHHQQPHGTAGGHRGPGDPEEARATR